MSKIRKIKETLQKSKIGVNVAICIAINFVKSEKRFPTTKEFAEECKALGMLNERLNTVYGFNIDTRQAAALIKTVEGKAWVKNELKDIWRIVWESEKSS